MYIAFGQPSLNTFLHLCFRIVISSQFTNYTIIILTPFALCVLVFRIIKSKFSEMIEHLRTIKECEECHIQRYARYASFLVSFQVAITPLFSLEECTLLVVALTVGHIVIFVSSREVITFFEPTHSGLVVSVGSVIPAHHTRINELWTLRTHIATPVLKNHIGSRRNGLDTLLVVVLDIAHRRVGSRTAKTMTEVHTETIDLVLGQPILE